MKATAQESAQTIQALIYQRVEVLLLTLEKRPISHPYARNVL